MAKTFLELYTEFHKSQTRTNSRFPEVLGITAIGHALGRTNTYPTNHPIPTYHNFYIFLIGPSVISHKSTSVDILFKVVDPEARTPHTLSPEALYNHLAVHPRSIIFFDEFEAFIKKMDLGSSYLARVAAELSGFYKCPELVTVQSKHWKTRPNPKGQISIKNIYPSVICCSTQTKLARYLEARLMQDGLLSRFLYIVDNNICRPVIRKKLEDFDNQQEKVTQMKRWLQWVSEKKFDFAWTKDAMDCAMGFLDSLISTLKETALNRNFEDAAIYGQAEDYIYKIANIYALDKMNLLPEKPVKHYLEVTVEDAQNAVLFVDQSVKDAMAIKKLCSKNR